MNILTASSIRSHHDLPANDDEIVQNIEQNLKAISATAGPYASYALGIDVSGWVNPANVDLQKWHDLYGVEFLLAKMGDGFQISSGDPYDPTNYVDKTFSVFCDMAYNVKNKHGGLGIPFGGYFYWRGLPQEVQSKTKEGDPQYKAFKASFKKQQIGNSIHFVEMDLEDHTETNTNTSKKANTWYHWMTSDPDLNPIWRLIYTSIGFITSYTPDSLSWIGSATSDVQLHMAQWPWASGKVMNWSNLEYPNKITKVLVPGNNPNRKFWQWAGDVAGLCKNALDLNFYWGTWQEMYSWLNFVPRDGGVTPPPDHACPTGQHWDESQGKCVDDAPLPDIATALAVLQGEMKATKDRVAVIENKILAVKGDL
jgi:hypothetical protein